MNNQKIENLLNLALDASDREREKSPELSAGFSRLDDKWTIIVRYAGNPDVLLTYSPVFLLGNYAILEVTEKEIEIIASLDEVIYIEKPKPLSFTVLEGRSSSCVSEIQTPVISAGASSLNLSGRGCIVGIIDSGIAYDHPVFLNPEPYPVHLGSDRIRSSSAGLPERCILYTERDQRSAPFRSHLQTNHRKNAGFFRTWYCRCIRRSRKFFRKPFRPSWHGSTK